MLPQEAITWAERTVVFRHCVTVTLKDINDLTDLIVNICYNEAADTGDSPHELYETQYHFLIGLLRVNTGKLLHLHLTFTVILVM